MPNFNTYQGNQFTSETFTNILDAQGSGSAWMVKAAE